MVQGSAIEGKLCFQMHPLEHRCWAFLSGLHQALEEVGCDWRSPPWLDKTLPSLAIARNNLDPQKLFSHFSPNEEWSSIKGIQDPGAMGSWLKTAGLQPLASWFSISTMSFLWSFYTVKCPIHSQSNKRQRFWLAKYHLVTMSEFSNDENMKLVKMALCHCRTTEVAGLGHNIFVGKPKSTLPYVHWWAFQKENICVWSRIDCSCKRSSNWRVLCSM